MKQIIPKSNKGFTLIELLVSAIVSSVILGVSLSLINTQRAQFLSDQARVQANQNLRAAADLMGTDIKVAGERLDQTSSLPVIQLIDGNGFDGDANKNDRLVLQRKLLSDVLKVCESVSGTARTIVVAREANLPSPDNCEFSDVDNGNSTDNVETKDALADNLNQFKNYRCSFGTTGACDISRSTVPTTAANCDDECSIAVIIDPATGANELFYYSYEECIDNNTGQDCTNQSSNVQNLEIKNIIHAIPLQGTNWINTYGVGSEIFIFEEREYSFDDVNGFLMLTINREDRWVEPSATTNNGQPLRLVNQLRRFDVSVGIPNTATPPINVFQNSVNTSFPFTDWTTIRAVRVALEAENPSESDLISLPRGGCPNAVNEQRLCLTSEFFPRNALSSQ